MRRIDLLPESYAVRRRERRSLGVVIIAGLVVLLLLVGWWFVLGTQVSDARDDLAAVEATNDGLRAEIAELQRFADLENEVITKRTALATVFASDLDWPSLLTELAMIVPGEVWLKTLAASAAGAEGEGTVGTETAPVDINAKQHAGRIQFTGSSLTMPGVAKWLIRLGTVDEFEAIWLTSAIKNEGTVGTTPVVEFDSTLELNAKARSGRFQGGSR